MTTVMSLGARLLAAMLVLSQALAQASGEALAQGSLRQLTEAADPLEAYTLPSVSANGAGIVFYREGSGEIYAVIGDGAGLRRLVGGNLRAQSPPSISADGQWITFAAKDTGRETFRYEGDVYVMRTDGSGQRQLTTSPRPGEQYLEEDRHLWGERFNPVISGDSSLVVFSSNASFTRQNGDGSVELFAVKSDGAGVRQITDNTYTGGPVLTAHAPAVDYYGTRVAFLRTGPRQGSAEQGTGLPVTNDESLYAVNTDGSGLIKLSVAACNMSWFENAGMGPAISGDGSLVAFVARIDAVGGCAGITFGFYTIKADGTGLSQLPGVGYPHFPSLSFDGSRIAFTDSYAHPVEEGSSTTFEVFVANSDGSGLTRLTTTPGGPGIPPVGHSGRSGVALSADGSHVAFASGADLLGKNSDHSQEIYLRRLTSLEPVQGVRNRRVAADLQRNRHSLVARRDLVVRAFFDTGVGGTSTSTRGRLIVDEGSPLEATFEVTNYTAQPLGYFDQDPEGRLRLEDSLNFFIAGQRADDLLTPGTHSFKVIVERGLDVFSGGLGTPGPPASGPQERVEQEPRRSVGFTPWEETFRAIFRQPDTVDIFIIPVRMRNAAGALVEPDAALLQTASDFLRTVFPVDESPQRVRNMVLAPLELNWPADTDQRRLTLARAVKVLLETQLMLGQVSNPARRYFAAGVVPYSVDGHGPLGLTASGAGRAGYTYPNIRGAVVSVDRHPEAPNLRLIGPTVAHEIGHQLGLGDEYTPPSRLSPINPPPNPVEPADGNVNGNYVLEINGGLDTANRRAVFSRQGAAVFGYMGAAGDPDRRWTTGSEYAHIYSQVTTDTVGAQAAPFTPTRFINVSGVMTRTGGITIEPFLVATSAYTFTRPSGTQYSFQFKDSGGVVLDTVGFDVDFTMEAIGEGSLPVEAAPFSFTVPLPEGVSSMVVLTGTTPMITYTVSARSPAVTVLAPNGGEELRGPGRVSWQASDADGDSLTYTVLYSPNGRDRYVVATGLTTTTLDLDFGRLPPGNEARVIVRSSDGFSYAEDASDAPFTAGPRQIFAPLLLKNTGAW